jgi:hypothetical protein
MKNQKRAARRKRRKEHLQLAKGDREADGEKEIEDKDANVAPRIFPNANATCAPELTSDQRKRLTKNQKRAARRKKRRERWQLAMGGREADGVEGTEDRDTNVVSRIFPSTNATCTPELTSDQMRAAAWRKRRRGCWQLAMGDREADGAKGTRDMDVNKLPRISPNTMPPVHPS